MSDTVKVMFGGLLHFVQNSYKDKAVKMCIVLPEAPGHHAVIGPTLLSQLIGPDGKEHRKVNIDGKRVLLRFSKDSAVSALVEGMNFEQAVVDGDPKGVVPIEDIVGDNADENPAIVSGQIDRNVVRSQVLLTEGQFSLPNGSPAGLALPNGKHIDIAGFINMTVGQVETAEIVVTDLEGSETSVEVYRIAGTFPGVSIVYLCNDREHEVNEMDEDFVYHYSLLLPRNRAAVMQRPHLPQIVKLTTESAEHESQWSLTPKGCNCAPSRGLSRPFDLDEFTKTAHQGSTASASIHPDGARPKHHHS